MLVMFTNPGIELVEFGAGRLVGCEELTQVDEGSYHNKAHLNCLRTSEYCGSHQGAVFGKCERKFSDSTVALT